MNVSLLLQQVQFREIVRMSFLNELTNNFVKCLGRIMFLLEQYIGTKQPFIPTGSSHLSITPQVFFAARKKRRKMARYAFQKVHNKNWWEAS